MTAGGGRRSRTAPGGAAGPLDLIHTNISPNPHGCSLSGRLTPRPGTVVYALDWGCSPAVIEAAFAIAIGMARQQREGAQHAKSTP